MGEYWKATAGRNPEAPRLFPAGEHDFAGCLAALNARTKTREDCPCLGLGLVDFDKDVKLREEKLARFSVLHEVEDMLRAAVREAGYGEGVIVDRECVDGNGFILVINGPLMGRGNEVRVFIARKPSGWKVGVSHWAGRDYGTGKARLFDLANCADKDGRPLPAVARCGNIAKAAMEGVTLSVGRQASANVRAQVRDGNEAKFRAAWAALGAEDLGLEELGGLRFAVRTERVRAAFNVGDGGSINGPQVSIVPALGYAAKNLPAVAKIVRELDAKVVELLAALRG